MKSEFVNLQITNTNITSENQELTKEKEISQKPCDSSHGTFNYDELTFIINYFKEKLENQYLGEGLESRIYISSAGISVQIEDEDGYVPEINIDKNYDTSLARDYGKDGSEEIIFYVEETAGGQAYWYNYYCLKSFNENRYEMFQIKLPCLCKEPYRCGEKRPAYITDVSGDILTISNSCFSEDDANCCPSSEATSKYKFDGKPRL